MRFGFNRRRMSGVAAVFALERVCLVSRSGSAQALGRGVQTNSCAPNSLMGLELAGLPGV